MTTLAGNDYLIPILVHALLVLHDGGDRLEGNIKINILPIGNTPLNSTRVICFCPDFSSFIYKLIVVL